MKAFIKIGVPISIICLIGFCFKKSPLNFFSSIQIPSVTAADTTQSTVQSVYDRDTITAIQTARGYYTADLIRIYHGSCACSVLWSFQISIANQKYGIRCNVSSDVTFR